jgi:hypothetical protein
VRRELPSAMLDHPADAFFRPDCFANLPQRRWTNISQVSDSFWRRFPSASLFDRINSLIGRFISLFGRLGKSSLAARHFNDLSGSGQPSGRSEAEFCLYLPVEEGNRRAGARPGGGRVLCTGGVSNRLLADAADVLHCRPRTRQPGEEDRVKATLSLGRRS